MQITILADGRRFAAWLSESYHLLITDSCRHTHFYDEFWQKTTHFSQFSANFWKAHPCLRKISRKRDPCLENFGPKIHPYPQHVMLPPGSSVILICFDFDHYLSLACEIFELRAPHDLYKNMIKIADIIQSLF